MMSSFLFRNNNTILQELCSCSKSASRHALCHELKSIVDWYYSECRIILPLLYYKLLLSPNNKNSIGSSSQLTAPLYYYRREIDPPYKQTDPFLASPFLLTLYIPHTETKYIIPRRQHHSNRHSVGREFGACQWTWIANEWFPVLEID